MSKLREDLGIGILGAAAGLFSSSVILLIARVDFIWPRVTRPSSACETTKLAAVVRNCLRVVCMIHFSSVMRYTSFSRIGKSRENTPEALTSTRAVEIGRPSLRCDSARTCSRVSAGGEPILT